MKGADKVFDHGPGRVFVFGSNLLGKHAGGAARTAREKYGALDLLGEGFAGNSYAIPTVGTMWEVLPLGDIKIHVDKFLAFARSQPELYFFVTRIGCGIAGYTDEQIAPMFRGAPSNCELPHGWPL